jgi:hypothetical protein
VTAELRIDPVVLAAGGEHVDPLPDGDDVFVFVVSQQPESGCRRSRIPGRRKPRSVTGPS